VPNTTDYRSVVVSDISAEDEIEDVSELYENFVFRSSDRR